MLCYDRIDVFERFDVNKTSKSKEYNICYYWYFLDKRFQPDECNGCHDLLVISMNLFNIALSNKTC